jgi:3-deoxy-manno-octulosonate cytidylyltransferase (CMP-KDO synthetase)
MAPFEFKVAIPARYGATRLPGKPLRVLAGRPLIEHVFQRALESGADEVVIATDDERVADVAARFGARVCLTAPHHGSGTERLAETAEILGWGDEDIVVNLQGDEPRMPAALIQQVAANLAAHKRAAVATLCTPIAAPRDLFDPHIVKVVRDAEGFALYFSRAPIPWHREGFADAESQVPNHRAYLRHIGLYAYRVGFLKAYVLMEPCDPERLEVLEQLRVLCHGGKIHVGDALQAPEPGIDTPEELAAAEARLTGARWPGNG